MPITITEQEKAELLEALKEEYGATDLSDDLARMQLKYLLPDGIFIGGKIGAEHNGAYAIPELRDICDANNIGIMRTSVSVGRALEAIAGTIQVTQTANSYVFMVHGNVQPTAEQLQAIVGFFQNNNAIEDDRSFFVSASGYKKIVLADKVTAEAVKSAFEGISSKVGRAI